MLESSEIYLIMQQLITNVNEVAHKLGVGRLFI